MEHDIPHLANQIKDIVGGYDNLKSVVYYCEQIEREYRRINEKIVSAVLACENAAGILRR